MPMALEDIRLALHDPAVQAVWAHSLYEPTPEKQRGQADAALRDPAVHAYGWRREGRIVGVLMLRAQGEGCFEILSIATDPACRGQGVGARMIAGAVRRLTCARLTAETDGEAVGFYRRCGFAIQSLGERYPGVTRYQCTLHAGAMPKRTEAFHDATD